MLEVIEALQAAVELDFSRIGNFDEELVVDFDPNKAGRSVTSRSVVEMSVSLWLFDVWFDNDVLTDLDDGTEDDTEEETLKYREKFMVPLSRADVSIMSDQSEKITWLSNETDEN